MEHIAFLKKWEKTLEKVKNKSKTIETRWYKTKKSPYEKINIWDLIYFKEWDFVNLKAKVKNVLFFENLDNKKVLDIFWEYKNQIQANSFDINYFKDKKYWVLIFLENPEEVKPFKVDKTWYWSMCSWIVIDDISKIKK